jgi:large subunit ribosomal protein L3
MINTLYATKIDTIQIFDSQGNRQVATQFHVSPLTVAQVKTKAIDGYSAYKIAISPKHYREIKIIGEDEPEFKSGDKINLETIVKSGDLVKVSGLSKGRGFAGVIKRHGFHGGPKTHGQSDRHRAPGSIGMRTTPGRVWKGKRMAGHYGNVTITIRNLSVLSVDTAKQLLIVSGTVPGSRKGLVKIIKEKTHGQA